MKKLSILFFSIFFLIVLTSGIALSAPRVTIPESSFDFGYVPQNSKIAHIFWLESTGDDTLKILKVVPGWGCTQAPLEKQVLAVGDSTTLEIIFSTKSYKSRVTKRPKIITNEGPPDKRLEIIATVVERPDSTYPVVVMPYKLDLTQFGDKVRDEINFKITNVSDQKLDLTMISLADTYFEVELPNSIDAGKTGEGKLKILKDAIGEDFEKSFTFQVSDEQTSRFTVPVKRKLQPSVQQATNTNQTTSDH